MLPPDTDIRHFDKMPVNVVRVRGSDLAAQGSPGDNWLAFMLWTAAWHQVPAGSLPDSDSALCYLAGLGRDIRTWRKHKSGAMHRFVLCSDGRWWHPVVVEMVKDALKVSRRGLVAASARWGSAHAQAFETNGTSVSSSIARPMPEQCLTGGGALPREEKRRREEDSPPTPPPGGMTKADLDVDFERWWALMPKRGQEHSNPKKPAKAKWISLVKSGTVTVDVLKAGARGYASAMLKIGTEPRGIAQAITWLNQARWEQYAAITSVPASDGFPVVKNTDQYRRWMVKCKAGERWPSTFLGPAPGEPGCRVPAEILAEFGPPPAPPPDQTEEEIKF